VAERATVARATGVRFSPIALDRKNKKEIKMNILFVCKYNAFRSRIAEEYFKKININPENEIGSEGLIMGGNPDEEQIRIGKELLGVDISQRNPMPLNLEDLKDADLIIIVANDIPKPKIIFNYQNADLTKKLIIWKIKDEQKRNDKNIKRIILKIKKKVDRLNKKLEKRK
jgi:protein-tyrosine-phosphatase